MWSGLDEAFGQEISKAEYERGGWKKGCAGSKRSKSIEESGERVTALTEVQRSN